MRATGGICIAAAPLPLAFVMLALLERLNQRVKFPVQFSFARGSAKTLADATRGIFLSSTVFIGGLTGQLRMFLPLEFVSKCVPDAEARRRLDVLALPRYGRTAPSSRYRMLQFVPQLSELGIDVVRCGFPF